VKGATKRPRIERPRSRPRRGSDTDTRRRLVAVASRLFWERGYNATGIAEIVREAEVFVGSLYHFFPTKQHLLAAVLEQYRDGIDDALLKPAWAGVEDPVERIFALLARYRTALVATNCFYGCPIGSLATELREPDPTIRELLAANFREWTGAVERCLAAAAPRISKGVDIRAVSQLVLSVMEGGVMQARTHRSIETFDAGVKCLRDYLGRLIEPVDAHTRTKPRRLQPKSRRGGKVRRS